MQIKKIMTAGAAALLLSGAAVSGVAMASSNDAGSKADTSTAVSVENSATDTDNVQEGDQTGPEEADANEATDTDNVQEGDQTGPDEADANEAADAETEGAESDGPGGHEDPPGNVDHEFDGEE